MVGPAGHALVFTVFVWIATVTTNVDAGEIGIFRVAHVGISDGGAVANADTSVHSRPRNGQMDTEPGPIYRRQTCKLSGHSTAVVRGSDLDGTELETIVAERAGRRGSCLIPQYRGIAPSFGAFTFRAVSSLRLSNSVASGRKRQSTALLRVYGLLRNARPCRYRSATQMRSCEMTSKNPGSSDITCAALLHLAKQWGLPWLACVASALAALALLIAKCGFEKLGFGALSGIFSLPLVLVLVSALILIFIGMIISSLNGMNRNRSRRVKVWLLPVARLCAEYSIAVFAVCFTVQFVRVSMDGAIQLIVSILTVLISLLVYATATYMHEPWISQEGQSARRIRVYTGVAVIGVLFLIALVQCFPVFERLVASIDSLGAGVNVQFNWASWMRSVLAVIAFVLLYRFGSPLIPDGEGEGE